MKLFPSMIRYLLFLSIFFLLETASLANPSLPWAVEAIAQAPLIELETNGIGLAIIILLETFAFVFLCRISFWRALLASAVINIFSSVVGILAALFGSLSSGAMLIIIIIIFLISIKSWLEEAPRWFIATIITALFLSYTAYGFLSSFSYWKKPDLDWAAFFLPIFLGFGWALLLESWPVSYFIPEQHRFKGLFWANIASYIFLTIMVSSFYASGKIYM